MFALRDSIYKVLSSAPAIWLTDIVSRRIYSGKIQNRGLQIDTNDPWITPWVRTLIFWDMYETAELRLIERYLPKDIDVIELGGSIGVVASHICARTTGRVVTVEANPHLMAVLKRNVPAGTTIIHGAIAYPRLPADWVGMSFGESSLAGWISDATEKGTVYQVPRVTLSGLQSQNGRRSFALISDIEGAEAGIFIRDPQSLHNCPLMIIELHETVFEGTKLAVSDLVLLIRKLGYDLRDNYRNVYVFQKDAHET